MCDRTLKTNEEKENAITFILLTVFLFLIFAKIFADLRSQDIFGVDGAFRCLEVYRRRVLFFHETNHMLYPVNVLVWNWLNNVIEPHPRTLEGFFATSQLMNSVAGAGCLSIFFYLTDRVASSWKVALSATVGYGFSRAFLAHSTNSAEVMMGIFWSFLAVGFASLALRYGRSWPVIGSGLLFSLAMATYQSTIFLAPAAIVLFWYGRAKSKGEPLLSWSRVWDAMTFICSGFAGCLLIFGLGFWYQGIRGPANMLKTFFVHRDARAYLGLGIGKSLNLPVGLVRNIFPMLPSYTGIRDLTAGPKSNLFFAALIITAIAVMVAICTVRLAKGWNSLEPITQTGVLVAATGLAFTMVPLTIWDPQYDKLWLQPLACLTFLIAVALGVVHLPEDKRVFLSIPILSLVFASLAFNISEAVRHHVQKNNDVEQAERLSTMVSQGDLLVGDWNKVAVLYGYGWANGNLFSFTTEAVLFGPNSVSRLGDAVRRTRDSGGRVYFLGILEESKSQWDAFLGLRCGVPFYSLDTYRQHSVVRATFDGNPSPIVLRQLESAN